MQSVGRTDGEQLNLGAAGSLTHVGRGESDAKVSLLGGIIEPTGYNRARAIGLQRGWANAEPAIANREWNLRVLDWHRTARVHRLNDLPEPGLTGRLPTTAC